MMWLKTKNPQSTQNHELESKRDPQQTESNSSTQDEEIKYPGLKVVIPVTFSLCLACFLVALDRIIISVAVPTISNQFNSFDDIAWYESAYLLTYATLQLPKGRAYTFFPAKWIFLATIVIFEIGSIVCAAAPNSSAFIIGRAIAGIGSAGTTTGSTVIFVDLLPLEKRAAYQGFLGATFGLASIAGPLLGGVFTSKITWRWCFWINLPVGGHALLLMIFILPLKPALREHVGKSSIDRVWQFDPIGTAILIPGLILLLLGLQWGGSESWRSTKVIVTLISGIILLVAFAISQIFIGENGTIPPRIICQRSIAAATAVSLGFGSTLVIITFYLPLWYQAITGLSAVDAGVRMIGYFLVTVVFVIAGGLLVFKAGYYTPVLIVGTALTVVGCGLFTTFRTNTSTARSIGYQVVIGAGLGLSLPQSNNAAQTVLSRKDIPIGITLIQFANQIGGTIFVSVCQGVLQSTLSTQLGQSIPGFDASAISHAGASDLAKLVPEEQLPALLEAYNKGIDDVFYCALAVACLAFVASWFLKWKSVKKQPQA
ncbi:putative efflux pump antibiotic resistance protein [Tothia fuscella]|uniref:Efflux pump antibiotic resistance protein n=1 Tax=Tothia fuscella TaxID=1048955 RepID=A0A9P4NDM4_9PEZI|nr:putative efflux pump antibiotic resistance protein [Tothia fuscella]